MGRLLTSATLTQKILRACALCKRLVQMPWSRDAKIKIVLTLILPLAFYGAEAAPPAEKPLERLTVAIAKVISFYSTSSSNLLAFQLATTRLLEPAAYIMLRRGQLMRRIAAKHPSALPSIKRILELYKGDRIMEVTTGEWLSALPP